MLVLRILRRGDEAMFRVAVEEFLKESPSWPFAFGLDQSESFADYVRKLEEWTRGVGLPPNWVPGTFLVGVVGDVIVGRLSLRHRLNDFLRRIGGHIGYGVIPGHRRRGYATEMLRQSLPVCKGLGIQRALVTCDVDNIASRKVIENCRGVFEGITNEPALDVQKRRYWISTV